MKKILLFLSFLLMSIGMWGDVSTLIFTSACGGIGTADDGVTWMVTSDGDESQYEAAKGIHYGTENSAVSYLSLATSEITGIVTKVVVNASTAKNVSATVRVTIGGSKFGGDAQSLNSVAKEYTFNDSSSGEIVVEIKKPSSAKKALYCKSIVVTVSDGSKTSEIRWVFNNDTLYPYSETINNGDKITRIPDVHDYQHCSDIFLGWTKGEYYSNKKPYILFDEIKNSPKISSNTNFHSVFVNIADTFGNTFNISSLEELTKEDVFIIVCKKDDACYAMSNSNGVSGSGNASGPCAVHMIPINDYILTDSVSVLWKLKKLNNNGTDKYVFYNSINTNNKLYCNDDNNGVRVGNGEDSVFTISSNYLYNNGQKRYLGVYNGQDWRCYKTINDNIKDETFYFYKRVQNLTEFHTACVRVFNNAKNDSTWTNRGNWIFGKLPDDSIYGARIDAAVIVDTTHAVAKHVIINQNTGNGKIIIQPNKGLEVDSTIVVSKNNSYHPTTPNDLILESSEAGNASLIFNNNNKCQATVELYSKANSKKNWQYIGTVMDSLNALHNYYGSWIYRWDKSQKWEAVPNGGTMYAWTGYCLTQEKVTGEWYETTGTLIPTDTKDTTLTVPERGDMVFTNSWTAPIHISKFYESGFGLTPMNVYLFNTGYAPGGSQEYEEGKPEAGTHIVVPVHAAPYLKDTLIAPQQGFFVSNTTNEPGYITMNYKTLVRGSDSIVADQMRAPRRMTASTNKPDVLKIYANGSIYRDNVVILAREDFSTGFDNGWDGGKSSFGTLSPSIYVVNNDGSYDAVSAIPELEGTLLGFRPGTGISYSMTFEYDGDETIYLNDVLTQTSTLIDDESRYVFTSDGTEEVRFVISETPYSGVATDIDNLSEQSNNTHKFLYNGNLYILKNNCIFNIVGSLAK